MLAGSKMQNREKSDRIRGAKMAYSGDGDPSIYSTNRE
jgi:hypothetical protein